jgi:hypothetical protein
MPFISLEGLIRMISRFVAQDFYLVTGPRNVLNHDHPPVPASVEVGSFSESSVEKRSSTPNRSILAHS